MNNLKMPIGYRNLVTLLFLYKGGSFKRMAKIKGCSSSSWRGWKKYLKEGDISTSGMARNSRIFLRNKKLFLKVLDRTIFENYLWYNNDKIKLSVTKALKKNDKIEPGNFLIATRLRYRIKNYRDVTLAVCEEVINNKKLYDVDW